MLTDRRSVNKVMAVLTVSNLTFCYDADDQPVLDGAALELPGGSSVGLLGANGSGKSTFLGAITNSIKGHCEAAIDISPDARGPIGYATQDAALYAHLSVRENLEHAARLTTRRWNVSDLIERAVEDYGLGDFTDKLARDISGGQARIAHLACAFAHQPSIRLLDEPTTALDFQTREKLINLINGWRAEGVATLVTAHYPEDIEELCEELVVLVDGKTTPLGRVDDHLLAMGVSATLTRGGSHTEVSVHSATLRQLIDSSAASGVDIDDEFDSISVRPPRLRDLLQRDPTLRSAIPSQDTPK